MVKMHDLKTTIANYERVFYFYIQEKSDINGNPCFRVFILDNETPHIYETVFQCHESQLRGYVAVFVENAAMEE